MSRLRPTRLTTAPLPLLSRTKKRRNNISFVHSMDNNYIIVSKIMLIVWRLRIFFIFLSFISIFVTLRARVLSIIFSTNGEFDANNATAAATAATTTTTTTTSNLLHHSNERVHLSSSSSDWLHQEKSTISLSTTPSSPSLLRLNNNNSPPRGLIIHTALGDIRIHFTPEYSGPSSIEYIVDIVHQSQSSIALDEESFGQTITGSRIRGHDQRQRRRQIREGKSQGYACNHCYFYRAEPNLLLQGIIVVSDTQQGQRHNTTMVQLGPCPEDIHYIPKVKCPEHDLHCGCHGPIMTKGMVGWAGGKHGPDFFINTHDTPVDWWGNQHTVWGMIHDDESFGVVENMYNLPAQHNQGMRMLDDKIGFSIDLSFIVANSF